MPDTEDRKRVDEAIERIIKTEGALLGHEQLCAERYRNILTKFEDFRALILTYGKVGAMLALMLFATEFSKTAFSDFFDSAVKAVYETFMHVH